MPNYDYLCQSCGQRFEILHKMNDLPPKFGPHCEEQNCKLEKQLAAPATVVRSANHMAAGVTPKATQLETKNNQPEPAHTCGSGCTFHRH